VDLDSSSPPSPLFARSSLFARPLLQPRRQPSFSEGSPHEPANRYLYANSAHPKRKCRSDAIDTDDVADDIDDGVDDDDDDDDDDDADDDDGVSHAPHQGVSASGELTRQLKRCRFLSATFSITVRTLVGKQLLINVVSTDTIDDVKARIEELEGIPVAQQRLVFGGRVVPDSDSLAAHNITDNGTELHLVLALRGGVCCASPNCLCCVDADAHEIFARMRRRRGGMN
jgi:hypothetical protein